MMERRISPRYAKVLFDTTSTKEGLEQRLIDFQSIINIFNSNPKLIKFLQSSQIPLNERITVLQNFLREKFEQSFINYLCFLIQKKRLVLITHIANEYRLLVNKYLGKWEACIVTAVIMDTESEIKLLKKLETIFHKKIVLNKKVDPAIIGGAILIISNEMLDWSVTGRLSKLKANLIATQV